MFLKVVDISFKSQFPSNVQLNHCDVQTLEVGATLLCWGDNAGGGQCGPNLEQKLFSKIGTRVGVEELNINNSISSIGLTILNVAVHPEDPAEKVGEMISQESGSGSGSGHMIFITSLATIIGISIGLGLVGLTVLNTRAGQHPFYLGTSGSGSGDLQHITSSEDITIIQGNHDNSNKVEDALTLEIQLLWAGLRMVLNSKANIVLYSW